MRHYTSRNVTSVVIKLSPSAAMQRAIVRDFLEVLEVSSGLRTTDAIEMAAKFVFDGDRQAARFIGSSRYITPAEFRAIVELRIWYKELDKQFKYRSPRFWFRTTDFVYCNVNSGKCVVFIDGHYWD